MPCGRAEDFSAFKKEEKEWSVFVFMSADNNLSSFAVGDIKEMETTITGQKNLGASTDKVNVLVEADFAGNSGSFRYYVKQFENRNLNSPIKSPVVFRLEEDYAGVKERFSSFIKWGRENYPAKRYLIVVWGHGEGYRGVAFDDSDPSYMSIRDVNEVLQRQEDQTDILAFDACLMQGLEVITEVRDSARYILGSNQIQNYLGLPYRVILDGLQNSKNSYDVAKNIPRWTEQSWREDGYQGQTDPSAYESFSMSGAISSELTRYIYPKLEDVSEELMNFLKERPRRRFDLLNRLERAPRFQGGTIDLGLLYGLLEELLHDEIGYSEDTIKTYSLLNTVRSARDTLNKGLLEHLFGPLYYTGLSADDYMLGYFTGLSIWLPKSETEYLSELDLYRGSLLFQELNQWPKVLNSLLNSPELGLFDLD